MWLRATQREVADLVGDSNVRSDPLWLNFATIFHLMNTNNIDLLREGEQHRVSEFLFIDSKRADIHNSIVHYGWTKCNK